MAKQQRKHTGHPGHHKTHKHPLHGPAGAHTTQEHLIHTAVETGKDLLIGVVGGGLAGAAIGKSSLLVGLLVTGAGHYMDNRFAQLVGIGMMASNGFQAGHATNGLEGIDGVQDRLIAYRDSFAQKFYLDKFLKKRAVLPASTPSALTPATAGIGEVQYFTYPDTMNGDLAALNDIESQLAESALRFQGQVAGDLPDMSGNVADVPDQVGEMPELPMGDIEDRLY